MVTDNKCAVYVRCMLNEHIAFQSLFILTSLHCRWQTRATWFLMPAMMLTVSLINCYGRLSPVYHTDSPPMLIAPETIDVGAVEKFS